MLRRSLFRLISVAAMITACSDPTGPSAIGTWGGTDASLTLGPTGGTLGYVCGAGTLNSGWALTSGGRFTGTGQHFFGGGPLPPQGSPSHPASYVGELRGDVLTLTVTLTDLQQVLGPFQMRRGGLEVKDRCV